MNVPSVIPTSGAASPTLTPPIGPPTRNSAVPAAQPPATATISPWASLLNRLQALAATDPAALRAVAGTLASTVHTAASEATGDEKTSLAKFGTALAQVAQDGHVAALHAVHHHLHPAKHLNGGTGALLSNLLQTVDVVLGPNANVTTGT